MKAAGCSWRTSSGRMPSVMQEDSGSSIGPPIRKNRMSVPSFFSDFARISEPVSSAICCFLPADFKNAQLDRAGLAELVELCLVEAEPLAEHLAGVLAEQGSRLE